MDLKELARDSIDALLSTRNKYIEDYIKFWLATQVPDAYGTPEWIADNLVLCTSTVYEDGQMINKYWVQFK